MMPRNPKKNHQAALLRKKKGIAYLTLNRPEVLNTINREMLDQLGHLLESLEADDSVRGVIITGAGEKAFSAGADIGFFITASPLEVRTRAQLAVETYSRIENLGKPVIAAINGYALGGGLELAEACTLRVAISNAKLGHPEVRIGAVAGWGGTTRLPRLIGKGRAAEMLLTGKMISAEEALAFGLLNRVVEPEELMKEAEALLDEILAQAPLAVKMTWEAMHRGLDLSLDESTCLGADYFGLIAATEDFKEGTEAFLKKKKPVFKGK
jgi:enoyl-CoA hydratase